MKSIKKISILIMVFLVLTSNLVYASPATSYTWTHNPKGRWTKTQDAYLPELTLIELGLKEPQDLFVDQHNDLYIADTGNKRVVRYSIDQNKVQQEFTHEDMSSPRGIYVTRDSHVYVADPSAETIFVFDQEGQLITSYGRPKDVAYGTTPFKPVKIAVDTKGNMYLVGEGVANGVIHLSNSGRFLGYFASNKVTLNWIEELQDTFFTEEQMANLASRVPITITNIFIDQDNILYSTTIGSRAPTHLAKHNTAGQNIFNELTAPENLIDLYVDLNGIVYAASLDGNIWIYSEDGLFIHTFGGFYGEEDISGLFSRLASIAVDHQGRVWAADQETSYIQSFAPSNYANLIYQALAEFNEGNYGQAEGLWQEVLKLNQMSKLAHEGLGKVYLYTERYEEALTHLEIAYSKYFYSQAYWEVRNSWLQKNLAGLIIGLLVLVFLRFIYKLLRRKRDPLAPLKKWLRPLGKNKILQDIFFVFALMRHPIDGFYDLKIKKKGTYGSTLIILLLFFGVFMVSTTGQDFLFQEKAIEDIDFTAVVFGFYTIILLFVLTNYLVSSIKDGDGSLGEIFKLTVYSFGPMIISLSLVTLLSYVLTYNEVFILDMISLVGLTWTGIQLLLGLQEIHNYTTRVAILSIIYSLGFMLIIAIVALLVILMAEQVYDFAEVIIREVIRNVF